MNVTLQRSYRSKKSGNVVFVYNVKGTQEELTQYEEIQGEHFTIDDKTSEPLWFTTRCIGDSGKLIITESGKIVADMSEFDAAASIAKQYGGDLGVELAKAAAQKLLGKSSVNVETAPKAVEAPVNAENADDL